MNNHQIEYVDSDEDNGTMPKNVEELREKIVGHRIVKVEQALGKVFGGSLSLTLDTGKVVTLEDSSDCCAYTEVKSLVLNADKIDHVITGVSTTNEFQTWHIYADLGDVLALTVGWSAGNPFYYGYGFDIDVVDVEETK
jgi:hypothetical protein